MSRTVKLLGILLAVSVALNVFILGFWAARFVRHAREPHEWPGRGAMEPEAAHLREKWREHAVELAPRRDAMRAARRAVHDALVAEPFDPDALQAALASLRTETDETQVALDRALVDFARTLTPEERRTLAESRWFAGRPGRGAPRPRGD